MDVASGAIQDGTPGQQYDRVFIVIMVFKAYDAFLGPFYDWLDGRWLGHQLRMPERKRRDKMVQLEIRGQTYEGHEQNKPWTIIGCTILTAMVVTGWAVSQLAAVGWRSCADFAAVYHLLDGALSVSGVL